MGQRGADTSPVAGEQRPINSDLWHACAGPLVSLPSVGSLVVYFPQGHSEQVAASMQKGANAHIPSYPNLPSKLICLLHSVNLHADAETDEVYAQMTLQPVNTHDEKALLASDLSRKPNKTQPDFFCKTLTASDTSTHGGFSVPRRAAEKIFPPLDFSMQPPCQEIHARDLHDNLWIFRHIFRGQPKRHLLTTGWSLFVSGKRLFAGDSVLFIRDEKQEFLLGIRRANRQPTNISSSVLSCDSMHIGVLAAAAHAATNHSPFTVFYNPRTTSSEFVIPLAKYQKALYSNQISLGMRFRMMFETEDSGTRRYMGTITGINDLDPTRWKNSQWRNLQVAWDESATGERCNRVSIWEIEPVAAPFFIYPPPFFGTKRPRQPGISDDEASEMENLFKSAMPWLGEEICIKDSQTQNTMMPGLSLVQWMDMQQNFSLANLNMQQPDYSRQLGMQRNIQFNSPQQTQQLQKRLNTGIQQWQQPGDERVTLNQNQAHMKTQIVVPTQVQQDQQEQHQQQKLLNQHQTQQLQQNRMTVHLTNQADQQQQISENQIQLQLLRKLQHQQQSILSQCAQLPQTQEKQRTLLDSSEHLTNPNLLIQQQPTMQSSQHKLQEQQVLPSTPTKIFSTTGSSPVAATGPQSGPTDDFPSCSTSPSTNNSAVLPQQTVKGTNHSQQEMKMVTSPNIAEFPNPEQSVNDSTRVHMMQRDGVVPGTYIKNIAQLDYLDSSSSATSVCVSQNNGTMQHTLPFASLNKTLMFTDAPPDFELQETGVNLDNSLSIPLTTNFLLENLIDLGKYQNNISGNVFNDYSTSKEAQQELTSSMFSQSYGVPNMGFNSIGSTINESGLLNKSSWSAPPQFQRMRTYTKVYKRGAVGRSIDISHYSGYDELRHDLARMFSIEGQLEDPHKIRWKLVYVDHESDVLLVGDDPWEEFVNCVRCIRILSPQEVQQINREGDLESSIIPEQACSSWNGGNALKGQREQNWGNPSAAGSYNSLE